MERFWAKVTMGEGCWEWQGSRLPKGYGRFNIGGEIVGAHRVSWELANGPIPAGLHVLHRCDNPPCVNPAHLWVGTNAENHADKRAKGHSRGAVGELNGRRTKPWCTARGEGSGASKLTEHDVIYIRGLRVIGFTTGELAKMYGVSPETIRGVHNRRTWAHVPENASVT